MLDDQPDSSEPNLKQKSDNRFLIHHQQKSAFAFVLIVVAPCLRIANLDPHR
jgi:hypothetical protein